MSATAVNSTRLSEAGRYDRRLAGIIERSTEVFCEKGYAAASMRDLSRATGMSLAGLYYYFESKEALLFAIQKHTFETVLERLRKRLKGVADPEQRLRIFIQNHVEYFLANHKGMKVLSHEGDVLRNSLGKQIRSIKRRYYETCCELVDDLMRQGGALSCRTSPAVLPPDPGVTRVAVMSLFGMMNWIYTWHNSRVDAGAAVLAQQMADLFLGGVPGMTRAPRRNPLSDSAADGNHRNGKRSANRTRPKREVVSAAED